MSNLRSDLIRLAHSNPDLRPHLLPVLKEAGAPDFHGWLNGSGLVQALKVVTTNPPSGLTPEQKAVVVKAAALLKAIGALPVAKAPAPPAVKFPPGNPLSVLPDNVVDAMVFARYPSYFDGELPLSSRIETLNDFKAKWAKMSPEELQELFVWIRKNSPMLRHQMSNYKQALSRFGIAL